MDDVQTPAELALAYERLRDIAALAYEGLPDDYDETVLAFVEQEWFSEDRLYLLDGLAALRDSGELLERVRAWVEKRDDEYEREDRESRTRHDAVRVEVTPA
jgi:hypothetical protein